MVEEIINRVASSKLKTFDLEEIYPDGDRVLFDIKDWLFQELILKEKILERSLKTTIGLNIKILLLRSPVLLMPLFRLGLLC